MIFLVIFRPVWQLLPDICNVVLCCCFPLLRTGCSENADSVDASTVFLFQRGHKYVIVTNAVLIELDRVFFSNRVVNLRNNLPVCTDFTSLSTFSRSPNNGYLLNIARLILHHSNIVSCMHCCMLQPVTGRMARCC